MSKATRSRWIAAALALCVAGPGCASSEAEPDEALRYIVYLHGTIVERGLPAISERYGEYEFDNIVAVLSDSGATVHAPLRPESVSVVDHADEIVEHVEALLSAGTPAPHVTIIGASKGAYIAALVSDRLNDPSVRHVLLAGCSPGTVARMMEDGTVLSGHVLAIRDALDVNIAGSCADITDASPNLSAFEERIVETGLEHGLIYTAHPAWLTPTLDWSRQRP